MSPTQHEHDHRHDEHRNHRSPAQCPVCGEGLHVTRLACQGCGTELVGRFERCRFCALPAEQLDLLTVFLASRGNLREVAKHQGVSYPTARSRLSQLLAALELDEISAAEPDLRDADLPDEELQGDVPEPDAPAEPVGRAAILAAVAEGRLDPARATALLGAL